MNNQTLSHAIDVQHEIALLDNILTAMNKQPHMDFSFTDLSGANEMIYTIKNESLVYQIIKQIEMRKESLEKEFKEL